MCLLPGMRCGRQPWLVAVQSSYAHQRAAQPASSSREGERQVRRREATAKLLPTPPALHPSQAPAPALRTLTQPLTHWSSTYLLNHQGSISSTAPTPLYAPSTPLPYPTPTPPDKQLHQHACHPLTGVRLQVLETAVGVIAVQGVSAPPNAPHVSCSPISTLCTIHLTLHVSKRGMCAAPLG